MSGKRVDLRTAIAACLSCWLLSCTASSTAPTSAARPIAATADSRSDSATAHGTPTDAATSATPPTGTAATEDEARFRREQRLIRRTMAKVTEMRSLASKEEVHGVVLDRRAIIDQIRGHVSRDIPKEAIEKEGIVLKLLGTIPTAMDYEKETFALLEAQIAGYYEPFDKKMYLVSDLDEDNAKATLAHELVHALQDQHFALGERSKYRPGRSDASSATSALAEGDATSAMLDIMYGKGASLALPAGVLDGVFAASMNLGPASNVPQIMKRSLAAPYVHGTEFVHALRKRGDWALVDTAWKEPPTTTEQVLHPEKWRTHEPALDVPKVLAEKMAALGPWTLADEDTGGELGLRILFEEWLSPANAAKFAAHWGGDRTSLFRKGEAGTAYAFYWRTRYDKGDANYARDAYEALRRALEAKIGKPSLVDANASCYSRKGLGPLRVAQRGRELLLLVGPTDTGANWNAASTCEELAAWARALE